MTPPITFSQKPLTIGGIRAADPGPMLRDEKQRRARVLRIWARVFGVLMLFLGIAVAWPAPTFKNLVEFDGTDGTAPRGAFVQGKDGHQYGTTSNGGTQNLGTVFEMTSTGKLTTIYNFCAQTSCTDGSAPNSGLVLGSDGNFYGTTVFGGSGTVACGSGCGTVFKLTPGGKLTTLHSFCTETNCPDGNSPTQPLIQGTDGNFYGTTPSGGGYYAQGTVFKITPAGKLTTLFSFCLNEEVCTDGQEPFAGLAEGNDGNFYGTTELGGTYGYGTIFQITSQGTLVTLYSFCPSAGTCTDGSRPESTLINGTDGNLYGMTSGGGTSTACTNGCGTIFKYSLTDGLTTLASFDLTHGAYPQGSALVQATDGNFYGVAPGGGTGAGGAEGTIFKLKPNGTLATLYDFCSEPNCDDGAGINALSQGTDGIFFGTTAGGGNSSHGTAFSLAAGLEPFVETVPNSGAVGRQVIILGTTLADATSVTFNGTAASFTVVSNTEITATVPTGATTGLVTVTTPTKTLPSNVQFQVP